MIPSLVALGSQGQRRPRAEQELDGLFVSVVYFPRFLTISSVFFFFLFFSFYSVQLQSSGSAERDRRRGRIKRAVPVPRQTRPETIVVDQNVIGRLLLVKGPRECQRLAQPLQKLREIFGVGKEGG